MHASSMPRMLEPLSVLTGTRGQFITEATVRKPGQTAISKIIITCYYMTNTSVSHMITSCIVLPINTLQGNWVEKKRQHSPSNTFLFKDLGRESIDDTLFLNRQTISFIVQPRIFKLQPYI